MLHMQRKVAFVNCCTHSDVFENLKVTMWINKSK